MADLPAPGVRINLAESIVSASTSGEGLEVKFADGGRRTVDHLLLGTGYRVDIARYPFLAPALLERVRRVNGYPLLGRDMESSVPGCISSAPRPPGASGRSCGSCRAAGTPAVRWPGGSWASARQAGSVRSLPRWLRQATPSDHPMGRPPGPGVPGRIATTAAGSAGWSSAGTARGWG